VASGSLPFGVSPHARCQCIRMWGNRRSFNARALRNPDNNDPERKCAGRVQPHHAVLARARPDQIRLSPLAYSGRSACVVAFSRICCAGNPVERATPRAAAPPAAAIVRALLVSGGRPADRHKNHEPPPGVLPSSSATSPHHRRLDPPWPPAATRPGSAVGRTPGPRASTVPCQCSQVPLML